MADVFISYKRDQRQRVVQLAAALNDLDLTVWWDTRLAAGDEFPEEIRKQADAAKAVIVCWTPQATLSPWVLEEAKIGKAGGKLAGVWFEKCPLPAAFETSHTPDLSAWNGHLDHEAWLSLARGLDKLLKRSEHKLASLHQRSLEVAAGRRDELVNRTRDYLITLAHENATASYTDAEKELGVDLDTLIAALDETAAINRIRREPPLCALIVAKRTGLPGRGFFQKHCFLSGDDDDLAEETFDRHVERVFAYPWTA